MLVRANGLGGGSTPLVEDTWTNCLTKATSEYAVSVSCTVDNNPLCFTVFIPKDALVDNSIYGNGFYVGNVNYSLTLRLHTNGTANGVYVVKNGTNVSATLTTKYYYR